MRLTEPRESSGAARTRTWNRRFWRSSPEKDGRLHDGNQNWYPGTGPADRSVHRKGPVSGAFSYSGGGIRTRDLRVMSPTSYLAAPPRGGEPMLATRSRAVDI